MASQIRHFPEFKLVERQLKLLPLVDRAGHVKLWVDPRSGWMIDLDSNAVALIAVDAVYDRTGSQLGWWFGAHLRNSKGQVVLFVSRNKIEGLTMPAEKPISRVPTLRLPSLHLVSAWAVDQRLVLGQLAAR